MTPEEFIAAIVVSLIIIFVVTVGYHQYKKGQRKERQPEEVPSAEPAEKSSFLELADKTKER